MKQSISITVEKDLVKWTDQQVETQRFRNRSHLVEPALMKFREAEKKNELCPAGQAKT
jgi:Arc/MetJ-type ribon-helix-helix transcriptional regulator